MPADRVTSKTPWHIVLVLDDSISMEGAPVQELNKAVDAMIEEMKLISQGLKSYFKLSVIKFGSSPHVLAVVSGENAINVSQVTSLSGDSGSTDAAAAFREVGNILNQNGGEPTDFTPYVFFLSDGAPDDVPDALAAAASVKSMTVPAGTPKVVTIGFGAANDDFMQQVASTPELYKRLADHRDMIKFFPQIGTLAASSVAGEEGIDAAIMNL